MGHGRGGEAITMSRAGGNSIPADVPRRRRVVVDVILLLTRNGRILLRERANTGYGDGAYEPPSGELADRETIVETAIRVASAAGIVIGADNVSLAHVMHDVSGGGRIAFFLSVSGWTGQPSSSDIDWFPLGSLPTNMLDRARVALRNYADGMRFSTYPAFGARGTGANGLRKLAGTGESYAANGLPQGLAARGGAPAPREQACGAGLPGCRGARGRDPAGGGRPGPRPPRPGRCRPLRLAEPGTARPARLG